MNGVSDIVLAQVGKARDLLAQVVDAGSAKRVVDMAYAAEVYAKRQKLSQEAIDYAHEIKTEALALLGEFLEEEKKAGRMAKGTRGQMRGRDVSGNTLLVSPEKKQVTLADRGITLKESSEAKLVARVKREKPAEYDAIKRNKTTCSKIHREERKQKAHEEVKEAETLIGKFRVFYADCPWKYGDAGYGNGPAEFHYSTMSVDELCALPVAKLALANSVLFFWVTSPLLEDAFTVINAWGFKYKASFIWDKVKHNVGHYNSVRHELLLIATRGSCTPDDSRLIDSVQEIERGEHSVKPERFREIIDQMYPDGKRIELFARKRTEGWTAWGNQV
jgi:N6-adenosine-specific RNA methylase IME4